MKILRYCKDMGLYINTSEWITKHEGSVRNSIMLEKDCISAYIAEKQ